MASFRAPLALCLVSALLSACALIAGVEEVLPRPSGGGGSGGRGGASSTGRGGAVGSGGTAGSGGSCPAECADYEACCGLECVNAGTDPDNCGTCGTECDTASGEICATAGATMPRCADVEWALWRMPDSTSTSTSSPDYQDNGDGTVTDKVTGLLWQKDSSPTALAWADAKSYCTTTVSNAGLGGHHDWRLPTRIELTSLVDYGVEEGPAIDAAAFPGTFTVYYWSATPRADELEKAWAVLFSSGWHVSLDISSTYRARCVH